MRAARTFFKRMLEIRNARSRNPSFFTSLWSCTKWDKTTFVMHVHSTKKNIFHQIIMFKYLWLCVFKEIVRFELLFYNLQNLCLLKVLDIMKANVLFTFTQVNIY